MAPSHKRRRLSSRAAGTPSSGPGAAASTKKLPRKTMREIWLDKLPEEVCQRLAMHTFREVQGPDALALAKASPTLRKAVLAALRHRLTITESELVGRDSESSKWISVFAKDIIELNIPLYFSFKGYAPPKFVHRLLTLPTLRVADISDQSRQLKAVARSSSIQEISIAIRGQVPPTQIFEALAKLPLLKLKTKCQKTNARFKCPFQDKSITGPGSTMIAVNCSVLTSLDVDCDCCRIREHGIWNVLPSLSALQEMTIYWYLVSVAIPKEALRFLSKLDSVRILGEQRDPHLLSSQIGSPVSEIYHYSPLNLERTAEQLAGLRTYSHLKVLSLRLKEGAETALPELVKQLPELTKLVVEWRISRLIGQDAGACSGLGYATPAQGIMLRTVQSANKLSELHFHKLRIPMNEVVGILQTMGRRLRVFATAIYDQREPPPERLELVLLTAAKLNSGLRELLVYDLWPSLDSIGGGLWKQYSQSLLTSIKLLSRRAPHLSTYQLETKILAMAEK